jgi:hypothetical protein
MAGFSPKTTRGLAFTLARNIACRYSKPNSVVDCREQQNERLFSNPRWTPHLSSPGRAPQPIIQTTTSNVNVGRAMCKTISHRLWPNSKKAANFFKIWHLWYSGTLSDTKSGLRVPGLARVLRGPCIGHLGLRLFLRSNCPVPDVSRFFVFRHANRQIFHVADRVELMFAD